MGILAFALLIVVIAFAAARAVRDEHFVLLRGRRGGWVLLARATGPRYRVISPLGAPPALVRYLAAGAVDELTALRARLAPEHRARAVHTARAEA